MNKGEGVGIGDSYEKLEKIVLKIFNIKEVYIHYSSLNMRCPPQKAH